MSADIGPVYGGGRLIDVMADILQFLSQGMDGIEACLLIRPVGDGHVFESEMDEFCQGYAMCPGNTFGLLQFPDRYPEAVHLLWRRCFHRWVFMQIYVPKYTYMYKIYTIDRAVRPR